MGVLIENYVEEMMGVLIQKLGWQNDGCIDWRIGWKKWWVYLLNNELSD